jgi:hypothetical protein
MSASPDVRVGASMSASHSTASFSSDAVTVIAVGVLAATLATLCHETVGHGLGCFAAGGHVTLLTSIWFRCSKGSAIADMGGPMGNLAAGALAVALLRYTRPSLTVRLLLLLFGALSLFWFTAQLTFESLTHKHEDWYSVLQVGWQPVGAVVGIGGYVLVGRLFSAINRKHGGSDSLAIRLAYAAAAASAVIAGLMWRPEPFRSALEEFLVLGIAPLGLQRIAWHSGRGTGIDMGAGPVPRSWVWISVCAVVFGLFLFIQARGLGSMADIGLHH